MAEKKKTEAEQLAAAELEQRITDARVMGLSWRKIQKQEKVNYQTARRMYTKGRTKAIKEATQLTIEEHIAEDLIRYRRLIAEAWEGWLRSVGNKQKRTTETKGVSSAALKKKKPKDQAEDKPTLLGSLQETKDKLVKWSDAGDRGFLDTINQLMEARNRLLDLQGAVLGKGAGAKAGAKLTQVELLHRVYIPGLGHLSHEDMTQFLRDIEASLDDEDDE
jgi:hypothetical protein